MKPNSTITLKKDGNELIPQSIDFTFHRLLMEGEIDIPEEELRLNTGMNGPYQVLKIIQISSLESKDDADFFLKK